MIIIATKPYSNNPKDNYLEFVLCKIDNKYTSYVTWMRNKTNIDGFYHGHYFEKPCDAIKDFILRK